LTHLLFHQSCDLCILIISSLQVCIYTFNNLFWVVICRDLRRGLHYSQHPKTCTQNVLDDLTNATNKKEREQ
jgi:hypothetical protein